MAIEGKLGQVGSYSVDLVDQKVKVSMKYDGPGIDAEVAVYLEAAYFMDMLAQAIPGQVDDAILGAIKKVLLPASA